MCRQGCIWRIEGHGCPRALEIKHYDGTSKGNSLLDAEEKNVWADPGTSSPDPGRAKPHYPGLFYCCCLFYFCSFPKCKMDAVLLSTVRTWRENMRQELMSLVTRN